MVTVIAMALAMAMAMLTGMAMAMAIATVMVMAMVMVMEMEMEMEMVMAVVMVMVMVTVVRRVFSAGLSLDARIRSVVGQWTGLKKANTDSGLGWALGPSCLLPKKGVVFFGVLFYG